MLEDMQIFDTNNYPESHILFSSINKKVPGKMQDEKRGCLIKSYASPKPKMLSLEVVNDETEIENHKRAKGIKKYIINKKLSHSSFKEVVLNEVLTYSTMNTFRSKNHEVGSYAVTKIGLHSFDDKRYLFDNIHSLAHGHFLIKTK